MRDARPAGRFDWSLGPGHGPVSGVLQAAASMLALTMWLRYLSGSCLWGMAAGIFLAATGVVVARVYDQPQAVQLFRAVCWLAAGFWSLWTNSGFHGVAIPFTGVRLLATFSSPGTPWSPAPLIGLAIGTAVIAMVGWTMDKAERARAAQASARAAELAAAADRQAAAIAAYTAPATDEEGIGRQWQPIIRKITRTDGLVVKAVEWWEPHRAGYTIDGQLPADGTTVEDIKRWEEALAAAAPGYDGGLPEGCGVEIERLKGGGRRDFIIRVTIRSALGEDIDYPDDLSFDTIENPVAIGVLTDFKPAEVPMRYETAVLVGNTDSGKSNELNVFTTGLGRCTDVLLVGLDMSGQGRFLRPWLRAFHENRAKKPMFANVAVTPQRAVVLTQSLVDIVNGRTADYAELMHTQNSDKIMVSRELPEIWVVVDEFATLPDIAKENLQTIAETGRGAAVRVLGSALEATSRILPGGILAQARVRVGMRVMDEAQLQYLFDRQWSRGRFDPASMPWKGAGFFVDGPTPARRFKGYRIDPKRVDAISVTCGEYRPELDALSLARGDSVEITVRDPIEGRIKVTIDGVWTRAQEETYPLIFPATAGTVPATGGVGTAIMNGANTMTTSISDLADGYKSALSESKAANTNLDNMMADLEAAANGTSTGAGPDTPAGDDEGDGSGDEDPALPSAAEMAAWLDMTAPERAAPPAELPADQPAESPPGPVSSTDTQGKVSPRRRLLQLLLQHAATGIGPSALHRVLKSEQYPTSITTVQNTLQDWMAREIVAQPAGDRTPYVPGKKFPPDVKA